MCLDYVIVVERRCVLPSIITDHEDVRNQQRAENKELRLILPPIITRTDATPRGSPKSELASPSPNFISGSDSEWEDHSVSDDCKRVP